MSAKERLQSLQTALEERGVKDVKFFFDVACPSLNELAGDVGDVLDAVLAGKSTALRPCGDRPAVAV